MALSTSAQKRVVVHPVVPVGPRILYHHPYWRPYYGFNYWPGRPAYYQYRPTKLEKQIIDIENDYADRISSVRADDSLTHRERRQKIRELRRQRSDAVDNLKKNYYKQFEN